MSVAWTQDGDGKYLVESAQHLLQIMNQGALYTDAGDAPTDYWASSYLQTVDVDLVADVQSILIIGNSTTQFTGEYDGGLFDIKNWAHAGSESNMGLFGHCNGAVIKHVRLAGVWTLTGDNESQYSDSSGFLCGLLSSASAVYDTEANFDDGTLVNDRSWARGTLVGDVSGSTIHGLTVRGSVTHGAEAYTCDKNGGVVGNMRESSSLTQCRNLANFTNGIPGSHYVGGVVAATTQSTLSKILNAMTGNMVGSNCTGGIIGNCGFGSTLDSMVNSMQGNVQDSETAGGVIGNMSPTSSNPITASRLMNYMKGDVLAQYSPGGILGTLMGAEASVTKSVVAMQGSVQQAVSGWHRFEPSQMEVSADTSFGMVYTANDHGTLTTPMVVDDAFVYDPSFADLPYIKLSGTDAIGTAYSWDFVYANIGGKYPEYTHLSVHTGVVSAPYYTDFGLADNDTVVYLTYANTDTNTLFHSASLTIVETAAATVTILAGPPVKSDFYFAEENVYDITEAGADVEAVVNELFATGDRVVVTVNSASTTTTFVNRGGQIDIAGANAILLPFDPAVADVQDATFTLSDATSVDVGFDQASGNIVVDGTTYGHGDYFVMDGQKVSVFGI